MADLRDHHYGASASGHGRPLANASRFARVVAAIAASASRVKNPWWPVISTLGKAISLAKTSWWRISLERS